MILSNVLFSLEFLAAVITLLFIGKLLLQGKQGRLYVPRRYAEMTSLQVTKRSLLNQNISRRSALA